MTGPLPPVGDDTSPGMPPDRDASLSWPWRALVALDQLANVWIFEWLFWSKSIPDETISSHAGRLVRDRGVRAPFAARLVCWFCNFIQTDHCKKAIGS